MNIEKAKATSLPEILRKLGHHPVKQKGNELLYYSPFRNERTASFTVNESKNVWYDFGIPLGGDVINFVCKYLQTQGEDYTTADALRWLDNMTGQVTTTFQLMAEKVASVEPSSTIVLQSITEIEHKGLKNYLEKRGIAVEIAKDYLKEAIVLNTKTDKKFHVLCLPNEESGFELRNEVFKGCIVAKSISFIRGTIPAKEIHIFEGVMDFLSALAEKGKRFKGDSIILNSVSCMPQAFAYLKNYPYETINGWLDNDTAGALATQTLKEFADSTGVRFHVKNKTYAPHKDVNEWHMQKLKLAAKPALTA